jgi:hypothetical protein
MFAVKVEPRAQSVLEVQPTEDLHLVGDCCAPYIFAMQVFTFHYGFERNIGILSIEPLAGQLHQLNVHWSHHGRRLARK